ncbi:helix-turn-helix domain-containing protein [Liquorilactobacillus oeni]|uniref:AraC family transcriptional regulator n=1 Tax=Liquorilactobacillus oeni DSM 19972 TaxID=1423777 RepID=A0A0R1MIM5_9LACO|nr:AraC family transcriptional regulator [Liquorilactobacillus oeni]KRL05138.1 AraC family transcriptional regulator [Liquorilactobacillus oeni DSM 19972]
MWNIKDQYPEKDSFNIDQLRIDKVRIFNTIELYFHNYKDIKQFKTPLRIAPHTIRIDYAYHGVVNFEGDKQDLYLEPDLLKIDRRSLDAGNYIFTDGGYEGITILIKESNRDAELKQFIGNFQGWSNFQHFGNYFFIKSKFIKNLFNDLKSKNIRSSTMFLKLKIAELILYLKSSQAVKDSISANQLLSKDNKILRDIVNYLKNNLDKQISLKALSVKFDVSQTKLKILFKKTYGETIHNYCNNQKMNYAADLLLQTDMKISQIAAGVGYINPSKFTAAFKLNKFSTPRNFRKKFK